MLIDGTACRFYVSQSVSEYECNGVAADIL